MKVTSQLSRGHCTKCGTAVWRFAKAQRDIKSQGVKAGTMYPLWPKPDSVYVRVKTPTGSAPGIAYCTTCVPAIGDPINVLCADFAYDAEVIEIQTAADRYKNWYTPRKFTFYSAWLKDAMSYDEYTVKKIMKLWESDGGQRNARR